MYLSPYMTIYGYSFKFYIFTVLYGLPYADSTMEALGGFHPEGYYELKIPKSTSLAGRPSA